MKLFKGGMRKAKKSGAPKAAKKGENLKTFLTKFFSRIMFTKKLKIAPKLLIGFLLIAILGTAMGLFATFSLQQVSANSAVMYKNMLLPLRNILEINDKFQESRSSLRNLLIAQDESRYVLFVTKININLSGIDSTLNMLEALVSNDAKEAYQQMKSAFEKYKPIVTKAIEAVQNGNKQTVSNDVINVGELYDAETAMSTAYNKLNYAITQNSTSLQRQSEEHYNSAFIITLILVALVLALSLIIGISTARGISKPVKKLTRAVTQLAAGDTDIEAVEMKNQDEISQMNEAFKSIWISVKELAADTDTLIGAASEGRLSERADAEKHQGAYRKIIEGFNETLDAVTQPVNEAAQVLGEVSRGNLEVSVEGDFKGDYAIIKDSLNETIGTLKELVGDTDMLIAAAVEGRLSERADAEKHSGAYKKILDGINATLDAVILPVNEAVEVLGEVSRGNLSVRVTGDFQGDHALLKDSLNGTIDTLKGYIEEISSVLEDIAQGNLNVRIASEYLGDFVELKDSINKIIESLNTMLTEINAAAEQMAMGTRQLSDGSQAISQGATEQASAIEELTGTVSEIAGQTKQNALNASKANDLSIIAKNDARDGNDKIKSMQKAMVEINQSSANIGKIIKEIDAIAFQTNILALNAAVEAARAGVHGRGFAVVAEEVRNLAARSAHAAQETTDLIEGSIKKAEAGTKIADDTAAALLNIVSGVEKAVELVGEIAVASNEQATGIAQVNKGIEQMSTVVQTNSATVQQAAASSQELSAQAELLKNMVGQFRLKDNTSVEQPAAQAQAKETAEAKPKEKATKAGSGKTKIILNDSEFGKY